MPDLKAKLTLEAICSSPISLKVICLWIFQTLVALVTLYHLCHQVICSPPCHTSTVFTYSSSKFPNVVHFLWSPHGSKLRPV